MVGALCVFWFLPYGELPEGPNATPFVQKTKDALFLLAEFIWNRARVTKSGRSYAAKQTIFQILSKGRFQEISKTKFLKN